MAYRISRRDFIRTGAISLGTLAVGPGGCGNTPSGLSADEREAARVFFTSDISSGGLLNIYSSLAQERRLTGRGAVKLHSGEPGGNNYPAPDLIKGPVQAVNGTIVECNTAYPGQRFNTAQHMAALRDHGFTAGWFPGGPMPRPTMWNRGQGCAP